MFRPWALGFMIEGLGFSLESGPGDSTSVFGLLGSSQKGFGTLNLV